MKKDHVTDLLSEYLDGVLPASFAERVKTHLIFCNACKDQLTELKKALGQLKNTPDQSVPPRLEAKIISAIHQQMREPEAAAEAEPRAAARWSFLFSVKGAAIFASALFAVLIVRNLPERPAPTVPALSETKVSEEILPTEKSVSPTDKAKLNMVPKREQAEDVGALSALTPAEKGIGSGRAEFKSDEVDLQDRQVTVDQVARPQVEGRVGSAEAPAAVPLLQKQGLKKSVALGREYRTGPFPIQAKVVIEAQTDWDRFWSERAQSQSPASTAPTVDFEKDDVVIITGGPAPSGGHRLEITSIEETVWEGKPARIVYYRRTQPPANAMSTAAITYPFVYKVTPKLSGPTFFKERR